MTITVGSSTPLGTYPITVTGNGGGNQHSATLNLTVSSWGQGFDFRNTAGFVTDPPSYNYVLPGTTYPTIVNGVTFGWTTSELVQGGDRSTLVDPRLAGINYASNGSPATFYVDLPSPGTYNLALAMGDDGAAQCSTQCQVQFLDGGTVLATVTGGPTNNGYFYDAAGNNWSAAAWPTSNLSQQVTLAGSLLTVVVGTNSATGDLTPIASLAVTQTPSFTLSASPASLSIQQGNQGTSTITTTVSGGFNSSITLSASGMPSGTTVSFNSQPDRGAGLGQLHHDHHGGRQHADGNLSHHRHRQRRRHPANYHRHADGDGAAELHASRPRRPRSASSRAIREPRPSPPPSVVASTVPSRLSASGMPSGTTVSFNPNPIPAPGSGNSTMTITVGGSTPLGTYPITVTGNGGGIQQNTTVTLTVTRGAELHASPPRRPRSASSRAIREPRPSPPPSVVASTAPSRLSASGMPSGTTVSFNPNPIPAPGSGNSTMTITVGGSTPTGDLSHHRDRQRRRHPAKHHGHADGDRGAQLHDFGLARPRSASRKAIREPRPSPPPSVVASTARSVCRLPACPRAPR